VRLTIKEPKKKLETLINFLKRPKQIRPGIDKLQLKMYDIKDEIKFFLKEGHLRADARVPHDPEMAQYLKGE
jgi:hypothetical protein